MNLLEKYKDKTILIVGHSTSIRALLSKLCKVTTNGTYYFDNIIFCQGELNYMETFKLTFSNENLTNIENIIF